MEELLLLGLIPAEDAKLRAAAVAGFVADERETRPPQDRRREVSPSASKASAILPAVSHAYR